MKDKLISKVAGENYKYFHFIWHNSIELHHGIPGKIGITECCPHFFVPAKFYHQNDWVFVESNRDRLRPDIIKAKENYNGKGCVDKTLFKECKFCKMPQAG